MAAYGDGRPGGVQQLVAAVELRPDRQPTAAEVDAALSGLHPADRPSVIRMVGRIPLTTWWRPDRDALRRLDAAGAAAAPGWVRDAAGEYRATPDPVGSATSG